MVAEKYKTAGSTARAMRASTQRPMTPGSGAMSVVAMSLDGMSVTSSVRRVREGRKMLGLSVLWCKATGRTSTCCGCAIGAASAADTYPVL